MINIKMCPSCWERLNRFLIMATLDERTLLQSIARKLGECPECVSQKGKLINASRTVAAWM